MAPKFIKSKKGRKILVNNGFQYHKHSSKKEKTYWVCTLKPECKARATTVSDPPVLVREGTHSHAPDQDSIAAKEIMNEIKASSVQQPEAPPVQITSNKLQRIPQSFPGSSRSLSWGTFFSCWDSLDDDEDDDDDDEEAEERRRRNPIIIFSTRDCLRKLCTSDTWLLDGTFKVSPGLFTQLFTIHGIFRGAAFPFVYALLPNKEQVSYTTVLEVVLDKCRAARIPEPEPTTVVSDFELGIINAVATVFPDADLRLCFFHLGQSVFRQVQDAGLQVASRDPDDRSVKEGVHELLSLAFVPPADVEGVLAELREVIPDTLLNIVDYFDDTYVRGRRLRGQRRAARPRYAPELWNQHRAALRGEPRTNNLTEGWHRRFNTLVGKDHPSVYALIKELQKEQGNSERQMADLELGKVVKAPQRLKYRMVTERLQRISGRYEEMKAEGRRVDFLRACGNNLTLWKWVKVCHQAMQQSEIKQNVDETRERKDKELMRIARTCRMMVLRSEAVTWHFFSRGEKKCRRVQYKVLASALTRLSTRFWCFAPNALSTAITCQKIIHK
ncbi:FLYWCH-type zinc finger-containing protein 1 [Frankliniella fusca]|uniref:FLYWCH-type zinc finger-containing protein 1 n=1 Tax=Frankliniella fusca TaxID=407009 RepID=A0AAE1HYW4_9NEOP|nr:FLYWCH-type zinc finger-containing protein 1 [Frankliniella fusca]